MLSKSLFWGFGGQHGLNMGPTWGPRGLQNREKSIKKDHILYVIFDWFFIDFGSLLGGFLVDFQCQVEGQVDKKSIIWPFVGKLAEVTKMLKIYCKNQYFWLSRPSNFEAKLAKKCSQSVQNSSKNLVSILIQFLMDFGGQLGSKILPKPGQNRGKSMKDGLPNQWKFCMLFEWPFSGSWKPTWLQNPSKIMPGGD